MRRAPRAVAAARPRPRSSVGQGQAQRADGADAQEVAARHAVAACATSAEEISSIVTPMLSSPLAEPCRVRRCSAARAKRNGSMVKRKLLRVQQRPEQVARTPRPAPSPSARSACTARRLRRRRQPRQRRQEQLLDQLCVVRLARLQQRRQPAVAGAESCAPRCRRSAGAAAAASSPRRCARRRRP